MLEEPITARESSADLLLALQERASSLLRKLRAYQQCLKTHGKQQDVEVRTFKRGVEAEVKSLNTILHSRTSGSESDLTDFEAEELESKRLHTLRSSNLPFYEALWSVARQSEGILALGKRVKAVSGGSERAEEHLADRKSHKKSSTIDVIARNGLEWIKVSTVTDKRLLFEMAREGWMGYGNDSDSEAYESDTGDKKDDLSQLELVRLAKALRAAARQSRAHFRHPRVRFILPKIQEGSYKDVDAVIADIRAMGIEVVCGNIDHTDEQGEPLSTLLSNVDLDGQDAAEDMTHLVPGPTVFEANPTSSLNIDCTLLLALISDISHVSEEGLPPNPTNVSGTYHKAIIRQIQNEDTAPLLTTVLYPLISDRRLLSTTHAVQRMREIVVTMGTNTEKERADVMLAENEYANASPEALREALGRLSRHGVPPNLQLPIQLVDTDADADTSGLSATTIRVLNTLPKRMDLSPINSSVFLYGWRKDVVTITSNRVVAHGIVRHVNEILDEEEAERLRNANAATGVEEDVVVTKLESEFVGPKLYVCETARSLIGKEKLGSN